MKAIDNAVLSRGGVHFSLFSQLEKGKFSGSVATSLIKTEGSVSALRWDCDSGGTKVVHILYLVLGRSSQGLR